MNIEKYLLDFVSILSLAILFSLPTLINGFPFIYFDSSFYIYNALNPNHLSDIAWRPFTYSALVWLGLHYIGLKCMIILQNLFLTSIMLSFSRKLSPQLSRPRFIIVGILCFLTPIPYISNFVMPDVFGILLFFLICQQTVFKSDRKLLHWSFMLLGAATHYLYILGLSITAICRWIHQRKVFAVLLFFIFFTSFVSKLIFLPSNDPFSKAIHYTLHSRFVAFKIDKKYFETHCTEIDNWFCDHREMTFSAMKETGTENPVSPSSRILSSVIEANRGMLQPAYLGIYFRKAMNHAWKQLNLISFTPMNVKMDLSMVRALSDKSLKLVTQYLNQEFYQLLPPRAELLQRKLGLIYSLSFLFSLIATLMIFIFKTPNQTTLKSFQLFFLYFIMNSIIVGFTTMPLTRYNHYLMGCLSFMTLCLLLSPNFLFLEKEKKND